MPELEEVPKVESQGKSEVQKITWSEIEEEVLSPKMTRRIATGSQVMICQISLLKGGVVPLHHHRHEQISSVVEGRLRFWLGEAEEEVVDLCGGQALIIPPFVPHRVEAIEDTKTLDIFAPPREDWLDGSDSYLRGGEPD